MSKARSQTGFTLVELAVVAGVLAILVGVVLPSIVEDARTDMGVETIEEIRRIQSAAVLFFHNSVPIPETDQPYTARWPGQDPALLMPPEDCGQIGGAAVADLAAVNINLVCGGGPPRQGCNPWYQPYLVSLAGTIVSCNLRVITYVPNALVAMFEGNAGQGSHLPQGGCGGACTAGLVAGAPAVNPPAGFSACCSTITRPGFEASLDSYHPSFNDIAGAGGPQQAIDYCDQLNDDAMPPMGYTPAGIDSYCRVNTGMERYDCRYVAGRCPNGLSAVGSVWGRPPVLYCCRTSN